MKKAVSPKSKASPQRRPEVAARAQGGPLYQYIFETLRNDIQRGHYEDGALLPSEAGVANLFGVSRITAKRALDEIAAAGMAVRKQGRGTIVRRTSRQTSVRAVVDNFQSSMRRDGEELVRLYEFSQVSADKEVAASLGLTEGTQVQRAIRVWQGEMGPFSHLTTFVPIDIASSWTADDMEKATLAALMERRGVHLVRAEESITATLADEVVAPRLQVSVGAPLLSIKRRIFNEANRVVELVWALHPAERYNYDISINQDANNN